MTSIDGKAIANTLYHAALVGGFAIGYAKLGQKVIIKGPLPKLDLSARDAGLLIMNVASAILTKDTLIRQTIIPSNIAE